MKRSRACETCQALKVKCHPSPDGSGICERCARLNITCVPAARRWQRDRISELEEQVKSLQEKLDGAGSSSQGLSSYADSTRATSVFSSEGTWPLMSATPSELIFLDARLDYEAQVRCLEVCSTAGRQFWNIIPSVDSNSSRSWLESIRTETPTKLLAMFAFAMSHTDAKIDLQTQEELRVKVLEILGQAAVGLKSSSLDLIQTALVAGLWPRPSLDVNGNPIQLVSLAHYLSVELGLGGPSMPSSAPCWFFRIQEPPTLEMQNTWLVSWMTSTMTALGLRRAHIFDWGSSHDEALHALETDGSNPLFLEMLYTIRLHAKVAGTLELCNVHSFHDINSDTVATTRAEIYNGLDVLSSRPLAHDPHLRFWRMLVAIYVNEPVLHTSTNKTHFAAPYLSERIGVSEFACPQVTETTATALRSLVEACHLAIDVVLEMEPSLILSLPSLCFGPAVSYTLSILIKVFVAVSAPGNTYSQILSRKELHVREAMHKLISVKSSLLKLDPHMGNWNTRIIGSVEWLGVWLDDYETIIERYETNLEREVADRAIGVLSPNGHF
ncbi:hypothetical protein FSARC_12041 [Fusarium sarcochroum]|uniref:Zn(2)-C6 fungal-type domain-containing protein n=1 Tax=Fusarium sarcochroum TaxID=1208366 RepID=A0A8H4TBB8_9HYPO|nr:hypothetical protein FSARC_12041 [Fusarium sarcochroum]